MNISPNPLGHHATNAIAVTAPAVSFLSHAPEIVTVVVGVLGIVWYLIIIVEKIKGWLKK